MSRAGIERRLVENTGRLQRLREELRVAEEQLERLADDADDARIRALVSETPLADRDHRDADRHADAMRRHHAAVVAEISELERSQDALLDQLAAEST